MSPQNTSSKRTSSSFLLSFLLLAILVACNDDKTKTSEQAETATSSTTAASPTTGTTPVRAAAAALKEFPVLCIDKTELESFYSAGVFKLVFNLTWDETKPLNPSLTVYKSRQNGEFIDGAVKTLTAYDEPWPIEGISNLGNLELTRQYYYGTLEPKANGRSGLRFYPVKSGDVGNRVTYKLLWGDCSTLPAASFSKAEVAAAVDQLNPCPPNQPGQ